MISYGSFIDKFSFSGWLSRARNHLKTLNFELRIGPYEKAANIIFDVPITEIDEEELQVLLKECRKAKKLRKAAMDSLK